MRRQQCNNRICMFRDELLAHIIGVSDWNYWKHFSYQRIYFKYSMTIPSNFLTKDWLIFWTIIILIFKGFHIRTQHEYYSLCLYNLFLMHCLWENCLHCLQPFPFLINSNTFPRIAKLTMGNGNNIPINITTINVLFMSSDVIHIFKKLHNW